MDKKEIKNLKVFGYGLAVILAFVAVRLTMKHQLSGVCGFLFAGSFCFVCLTRFRLAALRPIYKYWMRAAHLIGGIVTALILSAIFYFIFGLVGIFLRLARKDLLNQTLEPGAQTYWIKKENAAFDKNNCLRQF